MSGAVPDRGVVMSEPSAPGGAVRETWILLGILAAAFSLRLLHLFEQVADGYSFIAALPAARVEQHIVHHVVQMSQPHQ